MYYYHHRFYDRSGEDGARGEASLVVDGLEQRLLFGDGEDLWTMVGELAKQLCGGEREARRVKIYARGRERGSRLYRKERLVDLVLYISIQQLKWFCVYYGDFMRVSCIINRMSCHHFR